MGRVCWSADRAFGCSRRQSAAGRPESRQRDRRSPASDLGRSAAVPRRVRVEIMPIGLSVKTSPVVTRQQVNGVDAGRQADPAAPAFHQSSEKQDRSGAGRRVLAFSCE